MQTENPSNQNNIEITPPKKRWSLIISWYLFGAATPFIVLIILTVFGIKPPKSKLEIMADRWGIKDWNDTFLLINVPVEPDTHFTLGIERNTKTNTLKEIGITQGKNSVPEKAIFVYRTKGKYNTPMVYYGSPEDGLVWRDLNFDGCFDQRIDYRNESMAINLEDTWVLGKGKEEVNTDRGRFYFDPNGGEWKPVP